MPMSVMEHQGLGSWRMTGDPTHRVQTSHRVPGYAIVRHHLTFFILFYSYLRLLRQIIRRGGNRCGGVARKEKKIVAISTMILMITQPAEATGATTRGELCQ